ncbi:YeeE/YedE thiosulfate transporter family protein [Kaistia dalseonensis]|uniref:Membrane protein YedE/YeeE n=1 Tax=Kaistia dalseonensis TaxID=410840 RepID=A0ABU0H2J8_9HYPH|nr:YeeE/YedE thiosulfate transporter family protein [Kaistia dalseonensis]MCX5493962.1 YeeE/YedE thiosulfate transporter family protein [Kaistia dalseonensis]MDQ0436538.1 putative membrane protein YedE/YeeE [Kaistia dalseonensis]
MLGFSPISATLGGALIGLGVGLLWIVNGRIAGVSNIFASVISGPEGFQPWRLLFLVGLPVGAMTGLALGPALIADMPQARPELDLGPLGLAIAGLLVGMGTALAHGCTSGHGVAGLARLSPRSIVAVIVFMLTAMATVFVARYGV